MSPELRMCMSPCYAAFKTPRPRQNDRHFADDIFKYIFLEEKFKFQIRVFLICIRWPNWQYGSTGSDNGLAPYRHYLKQCWYVLQTHICVTRPQSTCNTSHEVYTLFVISNGLLVVILSLQWRHNECHGVSNRRCVDCLLNRLFRRRSKKTSKPRVTGLHKGPVTQKTFPFDDVIISLGLGSVESFTTSRHGCSTGTGPILWLPQCQWYHSHAPLVNEGCMNITCNSWYINVCNKPHTLCVLV